MLVFGDAVRRETVPEKLAQIHGFLAAAIEAPSGIIRHGHWVAALIEAGELAQGIADRAYEARGGRDGPSSKAEQAMALTRALAEIVGRSWVGDEDLSLVKVQALADEIGDGDPGQILTIKQPEGFGFYCVYPEAFFEAALALKDRNLRAIGIRSIGTTLAAMVSAAVDGPCPVTVRPSGDPYARMLSATEEFTEALVPDPQANYAIVDEGPGASGSSVLAVANALEAAGAGRERIHLFPSHRNGPGAMASDATRDFWRETPTYVVSFDELALSSDDPRHRVESWVSDLVGPPTGPLLDISAGRWRSLRFESEADWPPVLAWQERRKFLLETATGPWLLRFAGLGRTGLRKLERAQRLAEAGFAPEVLGYRHGFTVERWHANSTSPAVSGSERAAFLEAVGRYLGFRTRELRAEAGRGATSEELWQMARTNAGEALGADAASLDRWLAVLPRLRGISCPIETDNRLHVWEWIRTQDGRLLKTDALDHHAGHDLVGCQDIAWDLAGASVEFELSQSELSSLINAVERNSARNVDTDLLAFSQACYPAFQLGYYQLAASFAETEPEAMRAEKAVSRYRTALESALDQSCPRR